MPIKDTKYKYGQTILKVYGYGNNKKIKVITMNVLRTKGIEEENNIKSDRCTVNDTKLSGNITRAKNTIFELAFCNQWEYFITITINPKKYDRTDLKKYYKDFTQWLKNLQKKHGIKIKYLLIPELHSDGKSWHLHGFISGLPKEHLKQFQIGDTMSKSLAEKVKNGDVIYNWIGYQVKFGFNDLEPVRNAEAVSKYITKYINKNLATSVTELNANLYYHSKGLKKAETIKKGSMCADIEPTYSNEYCTVAWLDYSDELLSDLQQSFIDYDDYIIKFGKNQRSYEKDNLKAVARRLEELEELGYINN